VYCGERGRSFSSAPEGAGPDTRLEACATCRGYLKLAATASPLPFPLIALVDLETTELDVAAMERGYERPSLKEFSRAGEHVR
jgi:hypothetical protein